MTNKEALEIIQQYHSGNAIDSSKYMSAMDLVELALEKQIPKKPKPHEDDEYSAKCPNCYDEVDTHWVHGGISYCPSCGQAILWE